MKLAVALSAKQKKKKNKKLTQKNKWFLPDNMWSQLEHETKKQSKPM